MLIAGIFVYVFPLILLEFLFIPISLGFYFPVSLRFYFPISVTFPAYTKPRFCYRIAVL